MRARVIDLLERRSTTRRAEATNLLNFQGYPVRTPYFTKERDDLIAGARRYPVKEASPDARPV
jgi:hypothetical protein